MPFSAHTEYYIETIRNLKFQHCQDLDLAQITSSEQDAEVQNRDG